MAEKDKQRYEQQIKDLLTNGYFIMNDGSKSCEHQRKIKKKREQKQLSEQKDDQDAIDEDMLADKDEEYLGNDDDIQSNNKSK